MLSRVGIQGLSHPSSSGHDRFTRGFGPGRSPHSRLIRKERLPIGKALLFSKKWRIVGPGYSKNIAIFAEFGLATAMSPAV